MILGAVLSFCESQLLSAILLLSGTSIKLESGKERRHGIHFSWHCYSSVKPLQVKNEICTFWFKSGLWSIVLSNTGARGDSEDHMVNFSFIIYMTPQKFTGGIFKNRSLKMEKWSLKSNSQQNIIQIFRKSYSMFLHLQKIWQDSSLALSSCFAVPSTYPKVLSSSESLPSL